MTSLETIGFVGIGAMGTPMAGNLARAGYPVMAFDLDASRTALEIIESSAIPADLARYSAEFWNAAAAELPAGTDHTAVYRLIAQAKLNAS